MTVYGKEAWGHLSSSFPDVEDMEEDTSVNVPHHMCDNGVDHNPRMHISKQASAWLFHCHNCNLSGYYRDRETISPFATEESSVTKSHEDVASKPTCYSYELQERSKWPSHARLWLDQYELLEGNDIPFEYSPETDALGIPINYLGHLGGWQWRHFRKGMPKYTTNRHKNTKYGLRVVIPNPPPTLYIVEDLLSMYKLHLAGCNALSLMGTKVTDIERDLKMFTNVTVWLDNDTAGHTGAIKLMRELDGCVKNVTSIISRQPKEIPMSLLKEYPK